MEHTELRLCNLMLGKYLALAGQAARPDRLGLDLDKESLLQVSRMLAGFGLLEKTREGVGSWDYYQITTEGIKAVRLRLYLLQNHLIKPRSLLESWRGLNTNQKIGILTIVVGSITAVAVAYFLNR